MEKEIPGNTPSQTTKVSLSPILGISPRLYIPTLYGAGLLVLLFLLLVLPGLRRPGSRLIFPQAPPETGIYVDGTYRGSVAQEPFVPAGKHTLRLSRTGHTDAEITTRIPGRIFATLLIPPRKTFSLAPELTDPEALAAAGARAFAQWSLTGPSRERYFKPMILSRTLGYLQKEGTPAPVLYRTLRETYPALTNWSSAADWTAAALQTNLLGRFLRDYPLAAAPLLSLDLPDALRTNLPARLNTASRRYQRLMSQNNRGTQLLADDTRRPATAGPHTLLPVPAGEAILGTRDSRYPPSLEDPSYPREFTAAPFYLSQSFVTNRQYSRFIQENPRWSPDNRSTLIQQGLADETYLITYRRELETKPNAPAGHISWHAAAAYCRWLEEKYPEAPGVFRLPGEYEWEWAVLRWAENSETGNLTGSRWTWCQNPHGFLSPLGGTPSPEVLPQRSIRGGSDWNYPGTVNRSTRAGLSPETCPPRVAIRPGLFPERSNN